MVNIICGDKYTTFMHNSYIFKENFNKKELRHEQIAAQFLNALDISIYYLNITFFPLTMYMPLPGLDTRCPLRL